MPEQVLACSGDSFGVELIVKQLLEMNRYICCANQQIVIIGIYNPGKRFHAAWCDDHAIAAKWNVLETNELFFEQLCTSFQDEEPGKPLIFKEKKISDVRFYRSYVAYWWGMVDSNHRRHCQQIYSAEKHQIILVSLEKYPNIP